MAAPQKKEATKKVAPKTKKAPAEKKVAVKGKEESIQEKDILDWDVFYTIVNDMPEEKGFLSLAAAYVIDKTITVAIVVGVLALVA